MLFTSGAIDQQLNGEITTANELAIKLRGTVFPLSRPSGARVRCRISLHEPCDALTLAPLADDFVVKTQAELDQLQSFTIAVRGAHNRADKLNGFILETECDPFGYCRWNARDHNATVDAMSSPAFRPAMRDRFELNPTISNYTAEFLCKVETWQEIRNFATNVQKSYEATSGGLVAHALPILYALLGAYAYRLRQFSETVRNRTFHPSFADLARLITALIAGTVAGLFNPARDLAVSPLATAFLVGYGVEIFFQFLDTSLSAYSTPAHLTANGHPADGDGLQIAGGRGLLCRTPAAPPGVRAGRGRRLADVQMAGYALASCLTTAGTTAAKGGMPMAWEYRSAFLRWFCALLLWTGRAGAAEPITIGFGMALTGGIAANGRAALIAMKLWEEDINKAGGLLGRPVKLVYYDDQSTPSGIPALYTKLLDVDKVDLVVSGYGTNMTVPAMPIVMGHNRLFMTLFALAINADFKYPRFFGMIPAGPSSNAKRAFSKGFFDTAKAMKPPVKTLAIVGTDAESSRNAIEGALENAKEAGLEVIYNRSYPPTTNDFSPIVRAIGATHADVVYVASYPSDSVGMVNAFHEVGVKARLVGGNMVGLQTTSIKTQVGPKLNGLVNYNFWVPTPATLNPEISAFLERYQAQAAKEGVDLLGIICRRSRMRRCKCWGRR